MANDIGALGAVGHGPLGDATSAAIEQALTGLSARQRVAANNVANLQTPGFKAGRLDFEASLATAIERDGGRSTVISTARSTAPSRSDGNNVDLDEEVVTLTKVGLGYRTMVEAMDAKLRLLRTTVGMR